MNVNDTTSATTRPSLIARLNDATATSKVPADPTAAPAPYAPPRTDSPLQSSAAERITFPTLDANAVRDALADGSTPGTPPSLTVQGLMDVWGQKGTEYDLDGDGKVGMGDLTSLLAQLARSAEGGLDRQGGLGTGSDVGAPDIFDGAAAAEELVGGDLTVDGLMEAWGSKNEMYDIDGDGQVGMGDLIQLLAQAEGAEGSAIPRGFTNTLRDAIDGPGLNAALPAEEDGAPSLSVPGLLESWGQKNEDYDLDGDGVVGMGDLVELLGRFEQAAETKQSGGARIGDEAKTPEIGTGVTTPELTLDGLRDAWGERGGMYDLNGDGQVGMADLIELLARQSGQSSGTGGEMGDAVNRTPPNDTANDAKVVQQMLDRMLDKFRASGFVEAPPSNLHQIVGGLNLSDTQQHALMSGIEQAYPQGLGLSVLA